MKAVKLASADFFLYDDFHLRVGYTHLTGIPKEKDFTFINHYHSFSEIVLITEGSAVQNINGTDYNVKKGNLFLLEGNTTHFFRPGDAFSIYNVLFDKQNLALPWRLLKQSQGYNMFFEVEPKKRSLSNFRNRLSIGEQNLEKLCSMLSGISADINAFYASKDVFLKLKALNHFSAMVTFISQLSEKRAEQDDSVIPAISKVIALLESNCSEDFSISQLACVACMSPRNFSRQFQKATGEPPGEYLHKLRMYKAQHYLTETAFSIDSIAAMCGFHDSGYFSKCFSRFSGVTAREYRTITRGDVHDGFRQKSDRLASSDDNFSKQKAD